MMFNLLPQEQKKAVEREYRLRLLAVVFFFLAITTSMSAICLVPTYLQSVDAETAVKAKSEKLKASLEQANNDKLSKQIDAIQNQITLLAPKKGVLPISDVIGTVLKYRVGGNITVRAIAFMRDADGGHISINGVAKDRESLFTYSKNMTDESLFKKVDLPIPNLAKNKDITFTATITGDF